MDFFSNASPNCSYCGVIVHVRLCIPKYNDACFNVSMTEVQSQTMICRLELALPVKWKITRLSWFGLCFSGTTKTGKDQTRKDFTDGGFEKKICFVNFWLFLCFPRDIFAR